MRCGFWCCVGGLTGSVRFRWCRGAQVAGGLVEAGHAVTRWELEGGWVPAFAMGGSSGFDVVFPALHGRWGEGGGLQAELEARGAVYVGSGPGAAAVCMDKAATKAALAEVSLGEGVGMLASRVVTRAEVEEDGWEEGLAGPVVVKPVDEGSSLGLVLAMEEATRDAAVREQVGRLGRALVERYVKGREVTVGVLGCGDGKAEALPVIEITPASAFYDYATKYERDDTGYAFGTMGSALEARLRAAAVKAHDHLGCRDLSRADFMVDGEGGAWLLEVNTMPGFTPHSLLPMAAGQAGLGFSELCDRLVRLAAGRGR